MAASHKVALVTGAGTGIGKAVALALMREGYAVWAAAMSSFTMRAFDSKGVELEGRYVTWATSDEAVANVSASGVVTALAAGTVTILATVDAIVGSARVDVSNAVVASLNIGPPNITMQQGESKTLSAIVKDTAGRVVRNRAIALLYRPASA